MPVSPIEVMAPAKINLFIHLISKRYDGYHNIESLFAFTDFGDLITVEGAERLSLEIVGPFGDGLEGEDNLVLKAARGLQKYSGTSLGAKITLQKNLPIASGIGGGSSDAAATIKALQKLWKITLPESELAELALSLGADVPACFFGKPVFVSGIGEELRPIKGLGDLHCVLVNPGTPVSTPEVFKAFDGQFRASISKMGNDELVEYYNFSNYLQRPAISLVSGIEDVLSSLESQPGCQLARMSGSGATCFGVFPNESEAMKACLEISKGNPTWWVKPGTIIGSFG